MISNVTQTALNLDDDGAHKKNPSQINQSIPPPNLIQIQTEWDIESHCLSQFLRQAWNLSGLWKHRKRYTHRYTFWYRQLGRECRPRRHTCAICHRPSRSSTDVGSVVSDVSHCGKCMTDETCTVGLQEQFHNWQIVQTWRRFYRDETTGIIQKRARYQVAGIVSLTLLH